MDKTRTSLLLVGVLLLSAACMPPPVPVIQKVPSLERASEGTLDPVSIEQDSHRLPFTLKRGFPEYVIGPGDILKITLRGVQLTTEFETVRPDSNISFVLVENIRAAGRTLKELDDLLTQEVALFLRDPKVDVKVEEFHSKKVSLLGAVESIATADQQTGQGQYSLDKKTTVLDLILQAGGTTQDAQLDRVQLMRDGKTYGLDLLKALSGDQGQNVVLQADDIVRVPGAGQLNKRVVVLGEVRYPNVYFLTEEASLLDAMGQAGGMIASALRDDVRVIRNTNGTPEMYSINFDSITHDLDLRQNIILDNNDIIYIPRSFVGDVSDVISKIRPLMEVMLIPGSFRNLYTTGGGLRLDTGYPPDSGSSTIFTQPLPGTGAASGGVAGKAVAPVDGRENKGDRREEKEGSEE